jgi:RIO-like serine/threonine protein kinase
VEVFRKKCHELAWTFLNTMNNVHHCHTLHNDMSPNNVMLHFPPNSADKATSTFVIGPWLGISMI